jgi:HEAT repeat protein
MKTRACLQLGQLKYRGALPVLFRMATEEAEPGLIWQAFWAIGAIGSRTMTKRLEFIARRSADASRRGGAVVALMQLVDRRARSTLSRVVADGTELEKTRGSAAEALGLVRIGSAEVRVLAQALDDPSGEVRFSALCAFAAQCGQLRIPAQVWTKIEWLLADKTIVNGDESVADRASAVLLARRTAEIG